MTQAQIKKQIETGNARKAELLELKAKGEGWTESLQEELDNLTMAIIDLQDELEAKLEAKKPETKVDAKPAYPVAGRAAKMIHVRIQRGHRYDPQTGKEVSPAFIQMFSFGEWQNFAKYHNSLGYTIVEVLHDPYGIAKVDVK